MSSTTQWTAVIISPLCYSFSPSRADPVQPPPQLHLKLNQKSKVAQEKGFVRDLIPTVHKHQAMLKTAV